MLQSDDERDPFRATDASATAQEPAAIRAALKSGTSHRQVAIAVGLTAPAVLKIVKRYAEPTCSGRGPPSGTL